MIQVTSILKDERIEAHNALVEMTIGDYLQFAGKIIDSNDFQRKRVIRSKIKEILKEDLLRNCLIPPIVLAVPQEKDTVLPADIDNTAATAIIQKGAEENNMLIIDGLQRTYVILELDEELKKAENEEGLAKLHGHKIRAEVYLGLNRIGLLYRMITLNTGQTTMSTRHLMEILYFDYSRTGIEGIKLVKDKDEDKIDLSTNEFSFKTILDGFNSYLEKNEALIDRTEILDNIKSMDVLKESDLDQDLFNDFLRMYKQLLDHLDTVTGSWQYSEQGHEEPSLRLNSNPFGNSVLDIFKKSQVITGFGAALGFLTGNKNMEFGQIGQSIADIKAEEDDWNTALRQLLKQLDFIKEKSKKIGNDQRFFFKHFFRGLFNPDADSYMSFNQAAEHAYNTTRTEKEYK